MRHKTVKKATVSKRQRQARFIAAFLKADFNISTAADTVDIARSTFYRWLSDDARFAADFKDAAERKIDFLESSLIGRVKNNDTTALIFALKTIGKSRGYIEGERVRVSESVDKKTVEILDRLLSAEIDVTTAALQFSKEGIPLPETLRVLLLKTVLEPPPPELPEIIKDEELERQYQESMKKITEQEEIWLPGRQEEVKELKDELKGVESFGPDAEQKSIERG
jgi:hypothetical protein